MFNQIKSWISEDIYRKYAYTYSLYGSVQYIRQYQYLANNTAQNYYKRPVENTVALLDLGDVWVKKLF